MSKRKTIEEIKKEFKDIHGDKYDYSLITEGVYETSTSKLPIICHCKDEDGREHGIFYQDRKHHIRGHGCPKCCKSGIKYTNEEFIAKASKINQNILFDKCEYVNSHKKIKLICKKHGEFETMPYFILQGRGCPKCGYEKVSEKLRFTNEQFISKANNVHNFKYDYSKCNYEKYDGCVEIICHEKYEDGSEHGLFRQSPHSHISGCGCPKCKMSFLENKVALFLNKNNIKFEYEKHFDWLGLQSIDFFLPDYNIGIECQGVQHIIPCNFGSNRISSEELFEYVTERDGRKYTLCRNNGVVLLYFGESCKNETCGNKHISSLKVLLDEIYDRKKQNI